MRLRDRAVRSDPAPGLRLGAARPDRLEDALAHPTSRFERAFAGAPIGMGLVDLEGRWLDVNEALCRMLGQTPATLLATTPRSLAHPHDVDRDERGLHDLRCGRIANYRVEKRFRHALGYDVWVLVTASMVRDRQGEPAFFVLQMEDVSERKEQAARLEYMVDHDVLTGVFNRRRFQQELSREAERISRYGAGGAVLMIDLDDFKRVNDSLGHKAGDDVLRAVAGVLRHRARQTDVLARVGGDEFAMILPETNVGQARILAEGIVRALGRSVAWLDQRNLRVTASVGIALFDDRPAADVLECADVALYEAKRSGRNRVAVHRTRSRWPRDC